MPIESDWFDEEQTIMHHRICGLWRINEVFEAMYEVEEVLQSAQTPLPSDFILDMREAEGIPSGILNTQHRVHTLSAKTSYTVIVGAHDIIRTLVKTMQRTGLNFDIVFADTPEEAVRLITQRRQATTE